MKPLVLLMFCCAAALIVLKSVCDVDGFLSPDSTNYLKLAISILDGDGLYVAGPARGVAEKTWFSIWPAGYPALIALFSAVLNIGPFWASKLLGISCLLAAMLLIVRSFPRDGYILSCVLLFGGTIEIMTFTWSEVPFTLLLIAFSLFIGKVSSQPRMSGAAAVAGLFLLSTGLFLVRYVGLFSIIPLAIYGAWYLRAGRTRAALVFLGAGGMTLAAASLYLLLNRAMGGLATGMPRIPAPESNLKLSAQLLVALIRESLWPFSRWDPSSYWHNFIALIFCMAAFLVIFRLVENRKTLIQNFRAAPADGDSRHHSEIAFLVVGFSYFASIVILRWFSQFDEYGFRLLHPASVVVCLAMLSIMLRVSEGSLITMIKGFVLLTALLSLGGHLLTVILDHGEQTFSSATGERIERYARVPEGAILIFGDKHANYIRPDLFVTEPDYKPYWRRDEPWAAFTSSLDTSRPVFVDGRPGAWKVQRYHGSVRAFLLRNDTDDVFELHLK